MAGNTFCARCGEALVPEAKFCGRCGEQVVSAAPRSTPPVTGAGDAPSRLPTQHALVVLVSVLLLVVVVLIGATLLGREAGGTKESAVAPAPTVASSEANTAESGVTETGSTLVECWNGETQETQRACPPPRGVAGMRWLFPSLARDFARCDAGTVYDGKIRVFECLVSEPGRRARVVYSEWANFKLGDSHYRRKYGRPDGNDAQFNVWSTTWVNDNFQTSRMFARGLPYSVTVASSSKEAATEVMDGLRFRSVRETDPYL